MARPDPRRTLAVVSLPAMAYSLSQTMLVPGLTQIRESLDTTTVMVTWLLISYLVSAAVCTPVFGRLGDMVGKKRVLLVSVAAFAVGNLVAALATDIGVVIAGRVIMGGAGGMFPLIFGIIRDEFPPERVGRSIGLTSSMLGIGSGVGLLVGGAITDALGWEAIFWLSAVASGLSLLAIWALVPESPSRAPGRVDLIGATVLSTGLVLVLFGISAGRSWGWTSPGTLGLTAAGLVVLALWLPLQARTPDALVDVTTLRSPAVLVTNVTTLLVGFGMSGSYVLVPQFVQAPESTGYGFGGSATLGGMLLLPGSLSMLVFGPLSGSVGTRYGHRISLLVGCIASSVGLVTIAWVRDTNAQVLLVWFVVTVGIGFAFAAMPNLIVASVPSTQTGQATGFNAVVRSVGGAVGTTVTAVVVASSAVGDGLPRDSGYRNAFLVCAAVYAVSAVLAFLVPRSRTQHVPVADELVTAP